MEKINTGTFKYLEFSETKIQECLKLNKSNYEKKLNAINSKSKVNTAEKK